VYIPRDPKEKAMQRALMHFFRPNNRPLVLAALKKAGREDLIGWDKNCLIPPYERKEKPQDKPETDRKPVGGRKTDGSRRNTGGKKPDEGRKPAKKGQERDGRGGNRGRDAEKGRSAGTRNSRNEAPRTPKHPAKGKSSGGRGKR